MRQAVDHFTEAAGRVGIESSAQSGGIASGVPSQVGHGQAEALHPVIEDIAHQREVSGLAEDGEEAGHVPAAGHGVFGLDADEQSQGGVASEFFVAGFGGGVSQQDGQQQNTPEDADGVGVTTIVAAGLEGGEQGRIGDGFKSLADGAEGG